MKIDVVTLISYTNEELPTSYVCETIEEFKNFIKKETLDYATHDLNFLKEIDTYKTLSDINTKSLESFLNYFSVEYDEDGDEVKFGGFMLFINGRYV